MSPQVKSTFTDPFTAIETQAVVVAGEEVASKIAVRVRDDQGAAHVAAILGRDYQLLPNRKVQDIADDIMSRTHQDLGGWTNVKTLWDGKRFVNFFASRNPVVNVGDNPLMVGLMIWNSYAGDRKTGFEIFALNPWCTNQYHSRNRFGFFAWRHVPGEIGRIDVDDALQAISTGIINIIAIAPKLAELRAAPLTTQHLINARAHTDLPKSKWGDVLEQLDKEQEKGTLYGLFQAMTFVASHQLAGLTAISIGDSITNHLLPSPEATPAHNHTTAAEVLQQK